MLVQERLEEVPETPPGEPAAPAPIGPKKKVMKMGPAEKEEFLRSARQRFAAANDADADERRQYRKDLAFLNGDQWPQDVKDARLNTHPPRPCLVINKIIEKVDQISGDFRQSSPQIKVVPVDSNGDPKIAEIFSGVIRHIEYNSQAKNVYCTAFDCVIAGGRGAWRIKVEKDVSGKQQIKIVRMPNPLVVYWDPSSTAADLSDARYMFVTEMLPETLFKEKYPNNTIQDWDTTDAKEEQLWRSDEKKVRVAEYWYWAKKPGKPKDGIGDDGEVLFSCLMSANEILDGPHQWPGKHIPIVVALGKESWIGEQRTNRGMVRHAREPQQMYNYWSSAVTEQIALAPTAPFLVTSTHIEDSQEMWDKQATLNRHYLVYTPDPLAPGGPRREQPPIMSSAIANELNRMEHDIMSSMGLYQANLGDEGQEKSGRAILARQREGDTGAFGFTSMFEAALTHSGKILIDLIQKTHDVEDIIRIRGEDETDEEVPVNAAVGLGPDMVHPARVQEMIANPGFKAPVSYRPTVSQYLNDLTVGTYDVRVELGPSYNTQRQEAAEALLEIVKTVPQAGIAAIDLVVKNLDVPGAAELQKRLEKMIPPGIRELRPDEPPPPPPPPDPELIKQQIAAQDLKRKEFEVFTNAIAKLIEAEAKERGQQLAEMTAAVSALKDGLAAGQAQQQMTQTAEQEAAKMAAQQAGVSQGGNA